MDSTIFNFWGWLKKNQRTITLLTVLVFAVYINALKNDFVADDVPAIPNNKNLGDFSYVISQPFQFIRPLLYFIVYKIGGLNPLPYRLINIFFHLGNTLLVYVLVSLLNQHRLALFTSSIFAVHPILIESVTWISGGAHTQYSFFVLLSLITYIFYLSEKDKKILIASVIFFVLALSSSEKAIILPLLALLFIFSFKDLSKNWKSLTPFFIIACYFGLKYIGAIGPRAASLQADFYQLPQKINPLVQIPIAISSYLELIFWPKNLTLYHSEMFFSQAGYLLRLGILILFLTLIVYFFKKNRMVFFWLLFFLVGLLPTLLPLGLGWIVAERYVYLSSIGIFFLIGLIIQKIGSISKNKQISYVLLILIILALSVRTISRNADWKNQDTLWLAAAKTSPSSPQNHNNLGDLYGRRGNLEKAVEEFRKAIELKPGYADAYHNLANTYQQMGQTDLAVENYQKAIEFNPNLWQSYQNLAAIYFEQENFEWAAQELEKAINVNPQNANLYFNLGIIYLKLDNQEQAQKQFQKAIELDPKIKQLFNQSGIPN